MSNFGSGHDLTVRGFQPRIRLCVDSSEPGACFRLCLPLSAPPLFTCCLSLSKIKIKKNLKLDEFFKGVDGLISLIDDKSRLESLKTNQGFEGGTPPPPQLLLNAPGWRDHPALFDSAFPGNLEWGFSEASDFLLVF